MFTWKLTEYILVLKSRIFKTTDSGELLFCEIYCIEARATQSGPLPDRRSPGICTDSNHPPSRHWLLLCPSPSYHANIAIF
jgi:hypothetical protein